MATRYMQKLLAKAAGIFADVSSSTDAQTAREDAIETAGQLARQTLAFSLAASTATGNPLSARLPVPGNGTYMLRTSRLAIESGAVAVSLTDYLTFTLYKYAQGAATTKTAIATFTTQTNAIALGAATSMVLVSAQKSVPGGTLQVLLTKTGAGQTTGVTNIVIELERDDDAASGGGSGD